MKNKMSGLYKRSDGQIFYIYNEYHPTLPSEVFVFRDPGEIGPVFAHYGKIKDLDQKLYTYQAV